MKNNILNKITNIYLIIMIIIFPLLVGYKGYENILEIKYYSFIFLSAVYFMIMIIIYFYELLIKNNNLLKDKKLTKLDYLIIAFLLINILSFITSPYRSLELFKGFGRKEGLLIIIIYILNYFIIAKTYKHQSKIFLYFSISSIIISFIAYLQFFGLNPLNLYKGLSGPYNMSFMTTIGNIDFLSAYYTIFLSISGLNYILANRYKFYHLLSLILGIFIFLLINVDSGKVAFLGLMLITLPYILKNNKYFSRFLTIIAIIIFGYFLNYFTNMNYIASSGEYKLLFNFNQISLLLFISMIIILLASYFVNKKEYTIKNYQKIYLAYIPLFMVGLFIIYNYDFGISFLKDFKEILHGNFDDNLGSYRIFLWKRSVELFKDYPILGTGADSFGLRFMQAYSKDVALLGELSINDTAANIYLTNLVNIGILGCLNYILIMFSTLKISIKAQEIMIISLAILCYSIQSFFNLSVVIVMPFIWILLGIYNSLNIEKTSKE